MVATKYGSLWLYPSHADVDLHGKESLTRYIRGAGNGFDFCNKCGVTMAHSVDWEERGCMGLNMRTLEGADIDDIKVYFDDGWAEDPQYDVWGANKSDMRQAKEA